MAQICGYGMWTAQNHACTFARPVLTVWKKIDISLDPALLMECRLGDWLALAPFPPPWPLGLLHPAPPLLVGLEGALMLPPAAACVD
jgi:hypothetical protein